VELKVKDHSSMIKTYVTYSPLWVPLEILEVEIVLEAS